MTSQTETIIIPSFDFLVHDQAELLSYGEVALAEKLKDQLRKHTNTIINVGGSEFNINDDQEKVFITYFENNEEEKIVVFLTFVNNEYWLGTMNTANGLTIVGGCHALWEKNSDVYIFKSILGFLVGFGRVVDYRNGVTKTNKDEEITLVAHNGIQIFYGKRVSESATDHVYKCADGSFYKTIHHDISSNYIHGFKD